MSKLEIIKSLHSKHKKLNKLNLEIIVEDFFTNIVESLRNGNSVELRGFGTFYLKEIKEKYSARNPKTGKLIYVPKKNKVKFKVSKKFTDFLN